MKKLLISGLSALLLLGMTPVLALADLPPPAGFHMVQLCDTIANQSAFPDIVLIERTSGPEGNPSQGRLIENGACFGTRVYKFSTLDIYWTTKEKFGSLDLNNLGEGNNPNLNLLAHAVTFIGGQEADSTHFVKNDVEYSIVQSSNGTLSLYRSKETQKYNDGRPNSVVVYQNPFGKQVVPPNGGDTNKTVVDVNNNPNPTPTPTPAPATPPHRGFWQSVLCFFGFSRNC